MVHLEILFRQKVAPLGPKSITTKAHFYWRHEKSPQLLTLDLTKPYHYVQSYDINDLTPAAGC